MGSFEYAVSNELDFEHVALVYNPECTWMRTNRRQATDRLDAIHDSFSDYKVIDIKTRRQPAATLQRLHEEVPPDTLFYVATGDSGPGLAVTELTRRTRAHHKNINRHTLVADHFGSTSDYAHAMYEDPANTDPRDLVFGDNVRRVGLLPLRCAVKTPDHTTVEESIVAGYVGWGMSGESIRVLNSTDHRNRLGYRFKPTRQLLKYIAVAKGFRRSKLFTIREYDGRQMVEQELMEYAIYNTDVAAEHGRPPIPAEVPAFFVAKAPSKNIVSVVRQMFALKHGTIEGDYVTDGQSAIFDLHSPVAMQKDGELQDLPAGTEITVKLHDYPYAALTNRPTVLPPKLRRQLYGM